MFGAGIGIAYSAPLVAGWQHLPDKKGLVSGGVLTGFGASSFVFSILGSRIINPKGLNAVNGVFPQEIYDRFPFMLRSLASIYATLALLGTLIVKIKKTEEGSDVKEGMARAVQEEVGGITLRESMQTQQFWLLWFMIISSATAGMNTVANYKQFAISIGGKLMQDRYQALIGSIGALHNGLGRLFWANISDKLGFKRTFNILTLMQTVLMFSYPFSVHNKWTFGVNTALLFFCLGGNLALVPPSVQRLFGSKYGTTIYGLLYTGFAIASIIGGVMTKALVHKLGYGKVFQLLAVMSIVANLLLRMLQPVPSYKDSTI